MKKTTRLLMVVALLAIGTARARAETVDLSSLDLSKVTTGWGTVKANLSIGQQPMSIGGTKFTNGVGTHAYSVMRVKLDGGTRRFHCVCGVDDETNGNGSVIFRIVSEHGTLFKSPVMRGNDKGVVVDLDVAGVKMLCLLVAAGQTVDNGLTFVAYDHADWATWCNGKKVLSNLEVARSYSPDQECGRITLRKGRNHLLVKISQLVGAWGYGVRFSGLVEPVLCSAEKHLWPSARHAQGVSSRDATNEPAAKV